MEQSSDHRTGFEAEVTERFGILPNFFRSTGAAPELIQKPRAYVDLRADLQNFRTQASLAILIDKSL